MWGDGDDGHLALRGPVAPEDAVSAWSVVLDVCLEDLGLAQFSGERAREILDGILDMLDNELRADGLQPPARL